MAIVFIVFFFSLLFLVTNERLMVSISRNLGASDGMQQYKGRTSSKHRIRGSTWRALVGDDKFKGDRASTVFSGTFETCCWVSSLILGLLYVLPPSIGPSVEHPEVVPTKHWLRHKLRHMVSHTTLSCSRVLTFYALGPLWSKGLRFEKLG